ncbi:MAG: cupin domain-containing protein [Sphingomonadaceae bacterium]|nr:cupin domain-containing protein [Sphingomonadaceae bacterium]
MPKLNLDAIPATNATGYPPEYADVVEGRWYRKLMGPAGLTDFGASHVTLKPGAWSSQRHWHEGEDELVVVLQGEATLVDDDGRTPMRAGEIAVFRKNDGDGHVLINESGSDCVLLAIGKLALSDCHYPDIDMHLFAANAGRQTRKDGSEF